MQTPVTVTVTGRPDRGVAYLVEVTADGCRLRSADRLAPGTVLRVEAAVRQQRVVLDGVVTAVAEPGAAAPIAVVRWTAGTDRLASLLPAEDPAPRRRFALRH